MGRRNFFKKLAYLIITIFAINYIAVKLYWYYSIWWFDMPMHFFGGFWIGLALIWLLSFKYFPIQITPKSIFQVIIGVLIIGVGWEVFEIIVNNLTARMPFNTLDTLSDIFFDLAGGTFSLLYLLKGTMLEYLNRVE